MNMAIPAKVALNEDATSSTETLNSFAREKYADEAKTVSVSERLEENTLVRYDGERRRSVNSECEGGDVSERDGSMLTSSRSMHPSSIWASLSYSR